MKVAFLCKGSRGDVEPLLALVLTFHKRHPAVQVVFVCCSSSLQGLESALEKEHKWLEIFHLPETCTESNNEKVSNDVFRQTILNREVRCCVDACTTNGVNAIVFNLFTLEGYLIARHLNVPSVAVSPFFITRTPPKAFKRRFAQEHPFLHEKLENSPKGFLSYNDIDHWMWRLFLDDISIACDTAGVQSFPLPYPDTAGTPQLWSLPRPTPLLYGVSPILAHREPFWPESVHVCGFWKLPKEWCAEIVDSELQTFVDCHGDSRLVYTGFGSMEKYMDGINWNEVLHTFDKVFESLQLYSIVQCLDDGPLIRAVSSSIIDYTSLHLCSNRVSHSWLFPKCSVAIHHGGAGTVSSAIIAGIPQIICPVMFDQTRWGEIIEWKGLGKNINTRPYNLTFNQLYNTITSVIGNNDMKLNVKKIKESICQENGLYSAVTLLEKELLQPN